MILIIGNKLNSNANLNFLNFNNNNNDVMIDINIPPGMEKANIKKIQLERISVEPGASNAIGETIAATALIGNSKPKITLIIITTVFITECLFKFI